jgi:hypothetical protein
MARPTAARIVAAAPQDPRAGSLSLGGLIELPLMHTGAQLGDHVGRGAELGRLFAIRAPGCCRSSASLLDSSPRFGRVRRRPCRDRDCFPR